MKTLFETHIEVTGKVLDMQLERQNVVSSNLANIKTQGYKPRELKFEDALQSALGLDAKGKMTLTNTQHMPVEFNANNFNSEWQKAFKPRVIYGEDRVNLDKEMATMAKTNLHYAALTQVLQSNFNGLKNIITEGQK